MSLRTGDEGSVVLRGAGDALQRIGKAVQAAFADRLATGHAFAIVAVVDARDGGIYLLDLLEVRILQSFENLVLFSLAGQFLEIGISGLP